jgi:hypothetical protein
MPLLGIGFFGVGATGPVAAGGELVRHATYGVLLGLIYPVLRFRRQVRVVAHATGELKDKSKDKYKKTADPAISA